VSSRRRRGVVKLKVLAILVVVAALAGGWKWSNPKTASQSAAPPAFAQQGGSDYTPSGWTWGEE
jgi:hypothetical protein